MSRIGFWDMLYYSNYKRPPKIVLDIFQPLYYKEKNDWCHSRRPHVAASRFRTT